ncbi:MAG: transglycosylase domain-containing protein, partial [Pyrinomonadaceae bacterium]
MAAELTLSRPSLRAPRRRIIVHQAAEHGEFARRLLTFLKVAAIVAMLGFAVVASIAVYSYINFSRLIDQQIAGGYLKSHAGLYAAPRVIEKGARVTKDQLVAALQTAGYGRDTASNIWNGSFQVGDDYVRVLPRQGTESHEWININFNQGHISNLSANDRADLPSYALEPELLTTGAAVKTGEQQTLTYQDIPPVLVQAILSIEDRRFFKHNGIDIRGIGRALVNATTSGSRRFRQGGSTITQQLVKNTYLTPERTVRRKFNEAIIAISLENRLSKQDILALYCNEIYLGQRSGVGVRGVAQAARVFFDKDLKDLSLAEAATIAGMIQSPARYAPDKHPDAAKARRDEVIAAMIRDGAVSSDQGQIAQALPVQVAAFQSAGNEMAPYYVDAVNRALEESMRGVDPDTEQPLRVQTTIDPDLQTAAERALVHQLEMLGKSSKTGILPQGAMVALDPHTGQVLAMVGGRSYAESQLNRATDAKRQPGSVFKPFVYAAALEAGISPLATYIDAPQTFQYGNATYSPDNYGKSYSMHDVLMRDGLVRSLNVVTVNLAMQTGLANVAATAAKFGLPKPAAYPAMALGTTEVTPLQVATAYSAFVNNGKIIRPSVIAGVMDSSVETSVTALPAGTQIIKPTTAYMITDMLSDVTARGTARRAKASFKNVAIAGKTGTSRDGWFVGYTPNLVCAVWIGYDDNKQLGLTGAEAALPAWIDFVKEAIAVRPSLGGASFLKPAGITTVKVDSETGYLAGPDCPLAEVVSVSWQFAPSMECYKHMPMHEGLLLSETTDSGVPTVDSASGPETPGLGASQRETMVDISPARPSLAESEVMPRQERKPTRKEVNQRGSVLVNDPVVDEAEDISYVGPK